jgi:lysophospholipase L1-like esterase
MKAYQSLCFFCAILMLIVGLCYFFPEDGVVVCGKTFDFPTLEEAMTKKEKDTESADEKLAKAEAEMKLQILNDSLAKVRKAEEADSLAYVDTLKSYENLLYKSMARIVFPNNDVSKMYKFFDLLDKCAKGTESLHILHYGDSQIEQDRITGYIRERLQQRFGGWGAGMVPAIQPIPSMSVAQSASDSLPRYIADGTMRQKLSHNRYGVLAQMANLNGSITLYYSARDWKKTYPRAKKFSKVSLFVGNTHENFSATLSYDDIDTTQIIAEANSDMSVLTWQLPHDIRKFSLRLKGKAEIYGVNMSGKSGVSMSNIPLRGSSGTFFTRISSQLLSKSMKALNTRLVIMEFGGNATPYLDSDEGVEHYKNSISRQIAYVKKAYPQALLLLIGPADMSTMIAGERQTYPFLETTIEALQEAAMENDAMFWNMYDVMGGRNSMLKWVEHEPKWAATDYVHFTETGAKRIAEVFVQSFLNTYDYYHFLKRNKKWSGVE